MTSDERKRLGSTRFAETKEMLDFCAERRITCDIELIGIEQINEGYEKMLKSDVK